MESHEAMARVLRHFADAAKKLDAGQSEHTIAYTVWPEFRAAVAAALAEIREDEANGVQRWREGRADDVGGLPEAGG